MKLFWKLFLLLLTTLLLTAAASIWMGNLWIKSGQHNEQQIATMRALGSDAVTMLESGGIGTYRRWLHQLRSNRNLHAALLHADGRPILQRPLQPELERLARRSRDHDLTIIKPPLLAVADRISGTGYIWVAAKILSPRQMRNQGRSMLLLRIGLMLFAIALISWVISRMITRPIRTLEQTAESLGGGNLSERTPDELPARRDEIGELARSFDRMATSIETLMKSHQQILRDISHELRSPLARLQVALELARNATGSSATDELNRIETEALRLNELIGSVLTLARFDEGGIVAGKEPLRLDNVIEEIVNDARFEAEQSGKTIDFPLPGACEIRGDRIWLGRALDNVIRNAVRHTPEMGGVEVSLQCDQERAVITVRDQGSGVDDAQLPHLFEPFFRASEARERFPDGGYGLGLSIAKRAIELHHGSIRAANHPDGGLKVTITLPR